MNDSSSPKQAAIPLVLMRLLIGWHFLYEGIMKLYNPGWSAKGYLMSAETMEGFYEWLASDSLIGIIDYLNVFALIFVGLTLLFGYMEKIGSLVGIALLLLYYFAHPAFLSSAQVGAEGNYWIVNKNLIEAAALFVLYSIPTGAVCGIGVFTKSSNTKTA